MKAIQPINVWKDGATVQASNLTLFITFDNLETEAVFEYHLSDADNASLVKGSFTIADGDYQLWGKSLDANTDAYDYAAALLNLTFI
jgi:hypothetical protein